ncbi:MAG TPA: TonB-dependent receptor plug domain-containing protein, partial [Longimicrobiaceae bacterium]|nr:TonB-dependent receptor plug domain-containing protein [Longimicrobiaceae bacterium]
MAVVLTALPARAQQPAAASRGGMVQGVVVDASTQQPLAAAYVRVRELGRNELSHGDGSFHFGRLSPGTYTVVAERLGYAPTERTVRVTGGDTVRVRLEVMPSAISLAGVVVTGTGRERGAQDVYRPTAVLSDAELRRDLGSSVAATLAHQPGISQRYNGPAAAQPVIRGLSGDRVLMLEDGARTGDLASMSADHAVTIEPLTARRIEVVRGPAGLLYGSNALGGVVNVIREEVPRSLPERITGTVSAQGESVNMGATAGASVVVPVGGFALRGELSGRTAGDTRTPLGVLPSTDLQGFNGGVGASRIFDRGFAGASVRHYGLSYGVPGEFRGDTIPGAHAGGVQIDLQRTSARVEAGLHSGVRPFSSVEVDFNYARFQQDEIEAGGVIGSQFGQLLGTGNVVGRHLHEENGLRIEGALGFWLFGKDLNTAGAYTGSRPARQYALAGYIYEELGFEPFRLEVGGRYDWTRINPLTTNPILVGNRQIPVGTRDFGSFSG